jgi:TonB-dependent starch-binding outer membrane protein SusC
MLHKFLLSFLLPVIFFFHTSAQQRTITGMVKAKDGTPLAEASVSAVGENKAVLTKTDGSFSITISPSTTALMISYVGLTANTLAIPSSGFLNITLENSSTELQDVVVVGYNTQKKTSITGAIASVNIQDLEQRRVSDVAQALQGQVAGVQVTQSTGAPGDQINIRIRGEGTIGNNTPLFIIDGIPTRDISFLSPADILTMTVLKDASAASIYGSRASAGVIVVTTKTGQKGKSAIDINYFNGIQKVSNLPQMLNASQYMNKMEEAWNNSGYTGTNPYTTDKNRADLANTNWLDELFETGRSQNLQLSITGGTDKIQFLMSGGYYAQDGIVVFDNDKYRRLNFRTNINASLTDRLTVGTNLQLSYAMQDKLSSKGDAPGIIRHALIRPPVIGVYKQTTDPSYKERDPFTDLPFYKTPWTSSDNRYEFSSNPVALAYFTDDKRNNFKTFANVYAEYAFLKNNELRLRTNLGVDLNLSHNKAFNENFGDDDGGGNGVDRGTGRKNRPNGLTENRGEEYTITWNNTLNYNKSIQKHSISILAGSEYITNYSSSIGATRSRFDYTSETFHYIDYGGTTMDVWNGGSASEWALFSLFGSTTYMYDTRYMLTANFRADASSRFAENNQWGYFPSISAGWKISNETFMKNLSWLSDLKLRASTGKLGNQEIDNYAFLTLLRRSGEQYLISRYGNPDLKWETTTQNNIGLDIGLLHNKLYLSLDYFNKNTSDILLPISLPSIVGNVSPTIVNAGEVSNKGIEIALSFKNNYQRFRYSINANMATVTNRVEKLHPNLPSLVGDIYRTEAGHALSSFYVYMKEGIYQNKAEITNHLHGTTNPADKPGDIRFKDLNNDGVINDNDRTFYGSPIPKLSYGLNMSGALYGFDFSILFQGVKGVDRYNDAKQITDFDSRPFNHSVLVLNSWNGDGTSNSIPRATFNDNGSSKKSSIFVEDASYLRLKNLEVGYSLTNMYPFPKIAQSVRLYISGQNLLTHTNYTGLDPESTDILDRGTYPQSKAILFGINVRF